MSAPVQIAEDAASRHGSPREVLLVFLKLGLTSFGGPIAHIGYFRAEFVARRRWLDEQAFADLVALCQFLPGPASSQTGFAIGLMRAGLWGGLAAWAGFTLPSAVILILFAYGAGRLAATTTGAGLLHGLKLVAVAIVAQAVWGMARSLCPDRERAAIATLALLLVVLAPGSAVQITAIVAGGLAGLFLCETAQPAARAARASLFPVSRRLGAACLVLFAALLLLPPSLTRTLMPVAMADAFYRAGALVFGGGHVVLPLLRDAVVAPGWVSDSSFLAGYGAAQAMPGPLFTFAAYLGAVTQGPSGGLIGAAIALVAIFLPGILVLLGTLPVWDALRSSIWAQSAMCGINAAVVGVLGAALYDPVWTGSILRPADFAVAVLGFVLLVSWQAPALLVVCIGALAGIGLGFIG